MRGMCFSVTVSIFLLFVGITLNGFAQDKLIEAEPSSLYAVDPIRLELDGIVICDENGGKKHKATLKTNFTENSTVLDVVNILGPGYLPQYSGTGSITWYFDDGSRIVTRLWPTSLHSKIQLEYNER